MNVAHSQTNKSNLFIGQLNCPINVLFLDVSFFSFVSTLIMVFAVIVNICDTHYMGSPHSYPFRCSLFLQSKNWRHLWLLWCVNVRAVIVAECGKWSVLHSSNTWGRVSGRSAIQWISHHAEPNHNGIVTAQLQSSISSVWVEARILTMDCILPTKYDNFCAVFLLQLSGNSRLTQCAKQCSRIKILVQLLSFFLLSHCVLPNDK